MNQEKIISVMQITTFAEIFLAAMLLSCGTVILVNYHYAEKLKNIIITLATMLFILSIIHFMIVPVVLLIDTIWFDGGLLYGTSSGI